MHVERVEQLVQGFSVVEIPVSVLVQHNLFGHLKTHRLKPIRSSDVRGVVEDRLGGGEVSVDGRDVVRLVGIRVEVVAQISQAEIMHSMT